MLVLVAGATGFIGSHLVQELLAQGHNVRALARESSDCSRLEASGVEVRRGSLVDGAFISKAYTDVEVAINLAGKIGGPTAREDEMRVANIGAVKTLLEKCQNTNVRQFIHCSTPGVVGMVGVAAECMPYRPAGIYERTKCEAERIVSYHQNSGRVPTTIVRPDFVYGPGDVHKLKMFEAIKSRRFPVIGQGSSLVHPTYIDDVIYGLMLMLDNPAAYAERFNLAGPEPVTIMDLISAIAEALEVKTTRVRVPVLAAKLAAIGSEAASTLLRCQPFITKYQVSFFTLDHASDTSKARQILGYEPRVHLTEGIERTVQWYKKKGYI